VKDVDKTKEQILTEMAQPHARIAELEASTSRRKKTEDILRGRTRNLEARVKELTCLYEMSRFLEKPRLSLGEILQGVIAFIPPAWQYPEITCARVILSEQIVATKNFKETIWNQTSDIVSRGERVGALEVYYLAEKPKRDEGPFLKEERDLLNTIAERLGRILEQRQGEEEEKEIQVQLQYAQRMETFETLAYGIAHTFNNLFMAIIGNTSVMLLSTHPPDPHYEKLRGIERAIDRGSRVTKQLLAYARKGHCDLKNLNLNQVVRATSESFGMTRKNITIHRELAEDLLEVRADQAQIEQVLRNLYVNAAEAMPEGGGLYLKTINVTHKAGEYVLVVVRDTGGGMDKEIAGHIFDPFFTTKAQGIGTGLGLAWAYGAIKAHSGYIDVDSEKGVTTTFSIYLPAFGKRVRIR